jgi:hypothetical protein
MRDIVEYKVVSDNQLEKMVSEVNSLISEGWEPLGGLQVVAPGPAPLYSQATGYGQSKADLGGRGIRESLIYGV